MEQVPKTWVSDILTTMDKMGRRLVKQGFSSILAKFLLHLIIFQSGGSHFWYTAKLWKIIKYSKKFGNNWRKAIFELFDLPSTDFLADSGYPKIVVQETILPLAAAAFVAIELKEPESLARTNVFLMMQELGLKTAAGSACYGMLPPARTAWCWTSQCSKILNNTAVEN